MGYAQDTIIAYLDEEENERVGIILDIKSESMNDRERYFHRRDNNSFDRSRPVYIVSDKKGAISHVPEQFILRELSPEKNFRMQLQLGRNMLEKMQLGVIVEMWDKKSFGRVKRAWVREFTPEDRIRANTLYKKVYSWIMVRGLPDWSGMSYKNYCVLQRMANFFGTV